MKRKISNKEKDMVRTMRNEDLMTLQEIADEFGVSRQRVHQILYKNLDAQKERETIRKARGERLQKRRRRIRELSEEGLSSAIIGERVSLSGSRVRQILSALDKESAQ